MNSGTPYHRLQHRRTTFDEVAALSVEGLNKSAIAGVKRIGWNTVDRWLQRAADSCRCFNNKKIDEIVISELQADEIRTIIHDKEQPIWIYLLRLRFGLVSGLQQSSEDEAIEALPPFFEISPVEQAWNKFL